jgi:hypothetical protein
VIEYLSRYSIGFHFESYRGVRSHPAYAFPSGTSRATGERSRMKISYCAPNEQPAIKEVSRRDECSVAGF